VKKFATLMILGCSTFALGAMADTMTGYISDSHCGAKHQDGSADSVKCVKTCVKGGADPVFVTSDGKVLKFSDKSKAMSFLGKKVTVVGTASEDTLTVKSVKAAK